MGADDQTLKKTLQNLRIFFLLTGLKLYDQTNPNIMWFIFHFVWLNTDTLMVVINAVTGISALELLFIAPCLTFSLLGAVKALFYKIRDTEVHELLDDLMILEARDSYNLKIANEIKDTEISLLHKVIKVFKWLSIIMMAVFDIGPLLLIIVTYFKSGEVQLILPFLDIYPFDALQPMLWPFVYIRQSWSVCIVILYGSAVDCILFACCTYLRIQFRLIQVDIENCIPGEEQSRGRFSGDIHFQNKFKELLKRHQELIRLSSNLENIFSRSILFNFMTSSLVICFTGFNVVIVEDIIFVMTFVIFLLMGLLQIWCLCYFGELLMSSSADVSDAVYSSKWYLANDNISKQLLILQTRSQNPCKLTASGFADVSLSAFMAILSKAWSYFALLNTIYAR